MIKQWNDAIVSKISLALYVKPGTGVMTHTDRPFHGFIINDEGSVKDYVFSDGSVMHTKGGDLFYLPKHSSYNVKPITHCGCYAINFDTLNEIKCDPFVISFRNNEPLLKAFKSAEKEWRTQSEAMQSAAMRSVYDIIFQINAERQRVYVPDSHFKVMAPAIEKISSDFTNNELTVASLSQMCNISEAYFRRLFEAKFGVSPKEYIIEKRLGYAKQLLETGELSVNDTALLCGYSEPTHFSREFAVRVGVSPSEYKRTAKGKFE